MNDRPSPGRGQTIIPAQVRAQVGAVAGTRLVWHVMPDGSIIVRAKTKSLLELVGAVKARKGKRVPVEAMNVWR